MYHSRSQQEILSHIALSVNIDIPSQQALEIKTFCRSEAKVFAQEVANTKSFLMDIINGTIEELLSNTIGLPNYEIIETLCIKAKK